MTFSKYNFLFLVLGLLLSSSCGKDYNCKCTGITTQKSGTSTTTTKIETVSSDKYSKKENARKMCENLKTLTTNATTTLESTCILE